VPPAVFASFKERSTYIAQGEALALLLALWYEQELLSDCHILFFIDNMGCLSALTSGSSSVADFSPILHAFWLLAAKMRARPWFEHGDTHANPSDGGSRVGILCPLAAALSIQLTTVAFPPWPRDVCAASPDSWMRVFSSMEKKHHDCDRPDYVLWRLSKRYLFGLRRRRWVFTRKRTVVGPVSHRNK
jgi:hypothetical protein